ncbi:MAG: AAA family ATPase [Micrococcales bacterium]
MTQITSPDAAAQVIVDFVLQALDSGNPTPVVLIDGRAGSGKSTLAQVVQQRLFKEGDSLPRVVHMDDLYDGWTGLDAGASYLVRMVLGPLKSARKAEWQEYNWSLGQRDRWREFEVGTPLIVEGCGSLSQAAAGFADLRVWLEVPESIRHERWLSRDGHAFDEQWPIWAAQEVDFYARERSTELADILVE